MRVRPWTWNVPFRSVVAVSVSLSPSAITELVLQLSVAASRRRSYIVVKFRWGQWANESIRLIKQDARFHSRELRYSLFVIEPFLLFSAVFCGGSSRLHTRRTPMKMFLVKWQNWFWVYKSYTYLNFVCKTCRGFLSFTYIACTSIISYCLFHISKQIYKKNYTVEKSVSSIDKIHYCFPLNIVFRVVYSPRMRLYSRPHLRSAWTSFQWVQRTVQIIKLGRNLN